MNRFAILAATCLVLAACGDNSAPAEQVDENATARGEVLGGSISDDMLPLDTVTSQSPPLREERAERAALEEPVEEPDAAVQEEPAPVEEPAPAEEAEQSE